MMERMGWTPGSGLGRTEQGRTGPLNATGNESRDGLGYDSSRTTTTTSLLPKLQFQNELSKCTKQDQTRALERLLYPVFELRGVRKEKDKGEEEEEKEGEKEETERRWHVAKPSNIQSMWESILTRIMMNTTERVHFQTKMLDMNPSHDTTRNLYLSYEV